MTDEVLKIERAENHVTLTLNRPEKRNAMIRVMIEALQAAVASVQEDKQVRVIYVPDKLVSIVA